MAKSLVNSPLVKTMVHGADPNVGRLLMAVGKCFDCTIRPEAHRRVDQRHAVVRAGTRAGLRRRRSSAPALKEEVVDLEVSLGVGDATATAFGCDLTQGYIDENAAYYSS